MEPENQRYNRDFHRSERPQRRRNPPAFGDGSTGPLALCRYLVDDGEIEVPAYIRRLFQGGLACLFPAEPGKGDVPDCWMVRDGINFPAFLRAIVLYYRLGKPVPSQFRPLRKIPPLIVENLTRVSNEDLPAVFEELRSAAFLPGLPKLTRQTCPTELPWERIRSCFQDFRSRPEAIGGSPEVEGLF